MSRKRKSIPSIEAVRKMYFPNRMFQNRLAIRLINLDNV